MRTPEQRARMSAGTAKSLKLRTCPRCGRVGGLCSMSQKDIDGRYVAGMGCQRPGCGYFESRDTFAKRTGGAP